MIPQIDRIENDEFETGSIRVYGKNFNSRITLLLINGINSTILHKTDSYIEGVMPIVGRDGVFSVTIMTRILTRVNKNIFSNTMPIRIKSINENKSNLRKPKLFNLINDYDYVKTFRVLKDKRLTV